MKLYKRLVLILSWVMVAYALAASFNSEATFILQPRVWETTTTTGTGAVTPLGANTGYRTFSAVMANTDTIWYTIVNRSNTAEWEQGIATWNTGNTLTRTTVLSSSNAGAAVNFSAGTKDIFSDLPPATLVNLGSTGTNAASSVTSETVTGTGGAGYLQLLNQSSAPGTPTSASRLFLDSSNRLSWKGTNGWVRTFDGTSNSADRVYTLPDFAGTVALIGAAGQTGTFTSSGLALGNSLVGFALNPNSISMRAGSLLQANFAQGITEFTGNNVVGWSNTSNNIIGTLNVGLSAAGAATVALGNGTVSDTTGRLNLTTLGVNSSALISGSIANRIAFNGNNVSVMSIGQSFIEIVGNSTVLGFGSGTDALVGSVDSGLSRVSAGVGAWGTGGQGNTDGTLRAKVLGTPTGYTVATLPAGVAGDRTFVTDQLTACAAIGVAPTGGGAVLCPVFRNATIWVGG